MDSMRKSRVRPLGTAAALIVTLSLSGAASGATLYDEAISGDLTSDEGAAPLVGALAPGENSVFGHMADFGDAFQVDLGAGAEIVDVTLFVSGFSGTTDGRVRMKLGDLSVTVELIDFAGDGAYSFTNVPLGPNTYLVKIFEAASPVPSYDYELRMTVPEPAPGLASLAALGTAVLLRRLGPMARSDAAA